MSDFKKDYYKILNVGFLATEDDIKLAYRKQAKKYHPDLHPNNSEYFDLIKEINEAYEILGNKNERFAYDQYLANKNKQETTTAQNKTNRDKRTHTKTTTVYTEERIYLKGIIFIKYFGKHDERNVEDVLRQTDYKITVTQTDAIIQNIIMHESTMEFNDVFGAVRPISLNIKQPVSCKVTTEKMGAADYKLEILDPTISNPEIIDVTKHEGDTFGTITGTFYGYVKKLKSHNEEMIAEECFGETGKTEAKYENDIRYYRKEYYHTDCATYWGNWIPETVRSSSATDNRTQTKGNHSGNGFQYTNNSPAQNSWGKTSKTVQTHHGCFGTFGSIISVILGCLLFLVLLPQLAFLLPFLFIPFILNLVTIKFWNGIARFAIVLFGLVFLLAMLGSVISNRNKKSERTAVKEKPEMMGPKYTPITDRKSESKVGDTLISHHLVWDDYAGKTYEGNFSIKKSEFNQSHAYKQNLNLSPNSENNYDRIVFSLKENDKEKLNGLYAMFDSIKIANRMNAMKFAETIVSSIQAIPYTIVLPNSCNAAFYQDEFTEKYLATPDARCDGFQKYGINTPVEFMTTMNGDCDTRTLFLYTVLAHYNYDVALLSSTHYSHSMLGINLPYDGWAYEHNNERYVFWETTNQNIKPGILSNEMTGGNYWRISLKSK